MEVLRIGINRNKIDAPNLAFNHVVDRIIARTPYTHYSYPCKRFYLWLYLRHSGGSIALLWPLQPLTILFFILWQKLLKPLPNALQYIEHTPFSLKFKVISLIKSPQGEYI